MFKKQSAVGFVLKEEPEAAPPILSDCKKKEESQICCRYLLVKRSILPSAYVPTQSLETRRVFPRF
ncbi:hypothetical protein OUZ56_029657 [Daphnia magna]|uniref:Uncharacterized protein n=1 Tax=Daphnia magna TaxID=35525 RepID=A0ABR0B7G7_9CRUS|nr:hypothetical protein OUZ56_029657 [Daphnia magna]